MKVVIDENLSIKLARALGALFAGEHEVVHIRDRFGPGVTDQQWIEALNAEGPWIVISGDRRITRNRAEYVAFRNSQLIGFFLSKGLYKARVHETNGAAHGAVGQDRATGRTGARRCDV